MNEREPNLEVTPDSRTLNQILAGYREPSSARSILEIVITVLPLVLLWVLMWASLDIGYWLCLLLAVPAAGFLVRLFMIQHDCGHGAFFRHRVVNDWVGRVIGVLTLTPYDYLAADPRHSSCDLGQSRSSWHWRHRHADGARISGAARLAPAAISAVPPPARDVRHWPRLPLRLAATAAVGIDAQRLAALGQHDGDQCRNRCSRRDDDLAGRPRPIPARAPADHVYRRRDRRLAVLRSAPVRGDVLGPTRAGICTRRRCTGARTTTCRRAALVHRQYRRAPRPPSVQPNSLLPLAARCCGITRSLLPSGGLRCGKASNVYAWRSGTKSSGGESLFAKLAP